VRGPSAQICATGDGQISDITQVSRAPAQLGSSNSGLFVRGAEALRARLRHAAGPPALALAGITTVEAANSFLKKV